METTLVGLIGMMAAGYLLLRGYRTAQKSSGCSAGDCAGCAGCSRGCGTHSDTKRK